MSEFDITKAEEHYSSLSDSKISEYLKKSRSEFEPSVIGIMEKVLEDRGIQKNILDSYKADYENSLLLEKKRTKPKYSWGMVLAAFGIVILISLFTADRSFIYNGKFDIIGVIAYAIGIIVFPVLIILIIRYSKKSKIDIKEVLIYGCLVGSVILFLQYYIFPYLNSI